MNELNDMPIEDNNFHEAINEIKKQLAVEKDQEKRSQLCEKLWHAYYQDGSIYFDNGNYEAALQQHLKASEFNEYVDQKVVFNLLLSIGIEYERLTEYEKAVSYYQELLFHSDIEKPDKAMLLQFVGQCFDKLGVKDSAYEYFKKLFSDNRDYDGGWYLLYRYAKLAYKYREFDTSLEYFHNALKIIPANEKNFIQSSLQHIGYIFLEEESYKEAAKHFKTALKIHSGLDKVESEILSGMAQAYFGLNKFSKAIKYSKKAIEIPHNADVAERSYFLLAFSYSVKKDKQKEQYYTEKLKSLKFDSPYLRELQ